MIRHLAIVTALAALAGCLAEAPTAVPNQRPTPFVVSSLSMVPATGARVPAASPQGISSAVWVSLPPGSIPGANAAAIRNPHTGWQGLVLVVDGGFDPVAVSAGANDTITITVQGSQASDSGLYRLTVPPSSVPVVIRSSPPPHKRDVPLNAVMTITFSEPMDSGSIAGAITLKSGQGAMAGSVVVPAQDSGILRAEFVPATSLVPSQTYTIQVGVSARSRDGASLQSAFTSDFSVTDSAGAPAPQFRLAVHLDPRLAQNPMIPATGTIPKVTVTYEGCASGCDTTYTGDVTIGLGSHPDGAVLGGTTTVHMVNGVAAFPDLWVGQGGIYSLIAGAPGAVPDTSAALLACAFADCWEWHVPMSRPRNAVGVGVVGGVLYAIGGVDSSMTPTGTVEAYDPIADNWTEKSSLPIPRYGFAIGTVDGMIYVAGGMTTSGPTRSVEAYNPATDTWSSRASLPAPTAFPAGGVLNGVLYVAGGERADSTMLTTVLAYDPATDQWTTRASLPSPRSAAVLGNAGGQLFVFGGRGFDGKTVLVYNPTADQWASRTPTSPRNFTGDWYWGVYLPTTVTTADLGVLVLSGSDGTIGYLEDPYSPGYGYDPGANQYTTMLTLPPMVPPPGYPLHASLSTAGLVNGELYLVGYQTWRFIPYGAPSPYAPPYRTSVRRAAH